MPRQSNFTGGEIAPELYGRTDVARYASSLRTCLNFISTPLGPLKNRPGTVFVGEVKDSSRATMLVPFIFSTEQTYVLEFGHQYIRFHTNGAPVESAPDVPLEVVTTYDEAHVFRLQFAQSGDVVTIVHPSYPPRELTRTSHTSWAIADVSFGLPTGPTTLTVDANPAADATSVPAQAAKNWWVVVTAVLNGRESAVVGPLAMVGRILYPNRPAAYSWVAPAAGADFYRVYRSRHGSTGPYGLVGESSTTTFNDDAQEPDYTDQPRQGGAYYISPAPYPATVAFFQDRRVFGGATGGVASHLDEPRTLRATRTGVYNDLRNNYDGTFGTDDRDPIELTLASRLGDEVRAIVPGVTLLVMTSGSEWTVSGGGDGPLTPTSMDARPRSQWGSAWLPPLVIGDIVLFVPLGAASVRDLENDAAVGSLRGSDLTLLAPHLFEGHTIVDWTVQKLPFPIIWCVRDDGVLLGLTYVKEHDVWAWHRHTTEGLFESICSVPEGNESALYAVVKRTVDGATVRYVERFASRLVADEDLLTCVFVDSALAFDGRNDTVQTLTFVSAVAWTAGSTAVVDRSAGTFVAGDVGDHLVLDPDGTPVRLLVTAITSATRVAVELLADVPVALQTGLHSDWAWARDTFSGLDHLEGLEVYGLADGDAAGPFTVAAGEVTLGEPAVDLTLGLRYFADAELLDVADPKDTQKRVTKAFIEVVGSRGLKAGESFDSNLDTWPQRAVADGFAYLPTDATVVEVLIEGTWNRGGRVVIRQEDPLPLTVLAVTREIESGGR